MSSGMWLSMYIGHDGVNHTVPDLNFSQSVCQSGLHEETEGFLLGYIHRFKYYCCGGGHKVAIVALQWTGELSRRYPAFGRRQSRLAPAPWMKVVVETVCHFENKD